MPTVPDYVFVDAPGCTTVRGAALCFVGAGACAVDVSTRLTKVERGVDSAEVDMPPEREPRALRLFKKRDPADVAARHRGRGG